MDTTRRAPKRPSAFTSNDRGETRRTDFLDDGRRRVTVFDKCGKEVRSYIEDPCKPRPWWKIWPSDPRHTTPVPNVRADPI